MPSHVNFFEKARHRVAHLRRKKPDSPRAAALSLALWSLEKAVTGSLSGDVCRLAPASGPTLAVRALVRGGVGDNLLAAAFLHGLASLADAPVSFTVHASAPTDVFRSLVFGHAEFASVRSLRETPRGPCDLAVDITRAASFPGMNEARLARLAPRLLDFVRRAEAFRRENPVLFSDEGQRAGMDLADVLGVFRPGQADLTGTIPLRESPFALVCEKDPDAVRRTFGLPEGFVTLHRESGDGGPDSLKLWPAERYAELVRELRRRAPRRVPVLVGSRREEDIPGALDLRGRTTFAELKALLQGSALHVGGEGLVPHLRHFLRGGPSVVLFGPTSPRHYGYPENVNLHGTLCPEGCEWLTSSWQQSCVRGHARCRSMEEITVPDILQHSAALLPDITL